MTYDGADSQCLTSSQKSTGWQPIETAPENESVLIYIPNCEQPIPWRKEIEAAIADECAAGYNFYNDETRRSLGESFARTYTDLFLRAINRAGLRIIKETCRAREPFQIPEDL